MSIFLGSTISGDPSGPLRSKPTFPLVFLYGSSLFPSPAHEKQLPRFFFEEGKFNPPAAGTLTFSFEPLSTPDEASTLGPDSCVFSLPCDVLIFGE